MRTLRRFDLIAAKIKTDARRFRALGADPQRVQEHSFANQAGGIFQRVSKSAMPNY